MIGMRGLLAVPLSLAVLLTGVAGAPAQVGREDRAAERVPGSYIVVYRQSLPGPAAKTDRLERSKGFRTRLRYSRALKGFAARLSERQVEELRADPDVAFVSPDRPVRAFASVPLAPGETAPTGVRRIEAATATTARQSSSANVAVLDTGIDLDHPDLNASHGKNCVAPSVSAEDDNGHGSHVAGTIAAKNSGSGVVGVAPGTQLYAVKVLDLLGDGSISQVICGVDWATSTRTDSDSSNDIAVANMSLGVLGTAVQSCAVTNDPLHKAICNSTSAGITYVVAAGNDSWEFDHDTAPDIPAAYPEVLTVTAMSDSDGVPGAGGGAPACEPGEADDRFASFSNFAATATGRQHTIAGPGVCIRSTWLLGQYLTNSGTSMAAPHLAGAVALCLGEAGGLPPCGGLDPAQTIQKMRTDAAGHTQAHPGYGFTGDPLRPVPGEYFGYLARAFGAMRIAPDQSAFEANGPVHAIARGAGLTYIGGEFTELRARTGGFAALGAASGQRTGSFPEVEGNVLATAPDGTGGFYIGGDFTSVGGIPRSNVAHLLANGSVDPAFAPNANASVRALAVSGSSLYAGGDFTHIGGRDRNRIAKLSATSGNAFSGWDPDASGGGNSVRALAVDGNNVYAGGDFANIGGLPRNRIAKLSATSGNAFSGFDPNADESVHALALNGTSLYVGGVFTHIGGQDRNRIAKLSAASGNAFSAWNPNANGIVRALAVSDGAVYAGGDFFGADSIGGRDRNRIAKLSAASGNAFSAWNPNASGAVRALAVSDGAVYAGGDFFGANSIGGQDRNRIAKLSATSGNAFSGFDPNADGDVLALAVSGTRVGAGGGFATVNAVTRNRIAALDANGVPTAFNPNANADVLALAVDGNNVYAGGDFTNIGGLPRNRIAKLSATSGNAFSGWDPDASGGGNAVHALTVDGNNVYAGGDFTNIGGLPRNRIAKLSATSGNAFSGWNPSASASVRALAVSDGAVYAGGDFNDGGAGDISIGGQARNFIAKLSATSGNAFSGWDPDASDIVRALAVSDRVVYAGGDFSDGGAGNISIGGQARNFIAKLSATSGNAFSGWDPDANASVDALALSGSALYAGGDFTQIGDQDHNRIAKLSATSGNAFLAFDPNPNASVRALAVSGSALYAGGDFTEIDGRPRQGYAQFADP